MAVKIGHASIDEHGKGRGGNAGDQTGREVYIREYYIHPSKWDIVLRPKKASVAEASAKACEAGCANNNIGYDMDQRNTAHTQAKAVKYNLSKIKTKCETDCSAFMTLCALAAGVTSLEYTGNAPTTSTMRSAFSKSGAYEVLDDKKYLTSDAYLKRGDILVSEGHHTVMVLSNGSKVENKSTINNFKGKVTADSLNIRKGPGTNYAIVGTLKNGTACTIVETKGTWGKLKNNKGWVSLNYIKKI